MPSLRQHQSTSAMKMLVVGESGSAKTGALADLIDAGYKLRILDFDNGLDVLPQFVEDKSKLNDTHFATLTDKFVSGPKGPFCPSPTAWPSAVALLKRWKTVDPETKETVDLGAPTSWGSDTILVVDSLTIMSQAVLRYILSVNNRAGQQPWMSDWGEAMSKVEDLLGMLFSDSFKCHVIVNSHITYIGSAEEGTLMGYPSSIGQKLLPKIPRYFNTVVMSKARPQGPKTKRFFRTVPEANFSLKVPVKGFPAEIPLATGLRQIIEAVCKPQT